MPPSNHGQDDALARAIGRLADEVGSLARAVNNNQAILDRIAQVERVIIMTSQELKTGLDALTAQQGKIAAEQAAKSDALLARIVELEALIQAGPVSPEVEASFTSLKAAAQALDDVIPDAPTT